MEYKKKGIISIFIFTIISLSPLFISFFDFGIMAFPFFLPIFIIDICLFLLSVYYFSFIFEKREKAAFLLSLILPGLFVISFVIAILLNNLGEFWLIGVFLYFVIYFVLLGLSLLIAHFNTKIAKVKYAFLSWVISSILFVIFYFVEYLLSFPEKILTLHNLNQIIEDSVGTFLGLFSHILFVILILINFYLNKKGYEHEKKKRILLVYIPILFILLLIAYILIGSFIALFII